MCRDRSPGADLEVALYRAEELIFAVVDRFGGSISAEHGIGVVKRDSAPGRSRKAGAARWAEFQIAKPLPAPCSAVLPWICGRARVRSRSPVQSSSSKCHSRAGRGSRSPGGRSNSGTKDGHRLQTMVSCRPQPSAPICSTSSRTAGLTRSLCFANARSAFWSPHILSSVSCHLRQS